MKLVLEISEQDLKTILKVLQKTQEKEEEKLENLDEYVFIPITDVVGYIYQQGLLSLTKNGTDIVKVKIPDKPRHLTKIIYNDKIDICNVVILTGYAFDEESLGLVQTLDPYDQVRGFVLNGEIIETNGLSKQEIIFREGSIDNKLYFLRKTRIDLNKDIKISLLTTTKPVERTELRRLRNLNNEKIKGLASLYGVNDDIENLRNILTDIIWYYKIVG